MLVAGLLWLAISKVNIINELQTHTITWIHCTNISIAKFQWVLDDQIIGAAFLAGAPKNLHETDQLHKNNLSIETGFIYFN